MDRDLYFPPPIGMDPEKARDRERERKAQSSSMLKVARSKREKFLAERRARWMRGHDIKPKVCESCGEEYHGACCVECL